MSKPIKKILFVLVFSLSILPLSVSADETATSTVTVNVRYEENLIWNGTIEFLPNQNVNINDNSGQNRTLPANSAMGALISADILSDNFSISDLIYYNDFDSLYVRCIDIVSPQKNACDNWQYVVNSTYPPVGMDKYSVSNGDTLYFYFGKPRRVTLSSTSVESTAPVTAKVESYDYVNNAWTALSGATVGATQPNPDDPYSPLVILSAESDENGFAQIILGAPGSYNIGLAMDYYYPSEPLSVVEPIVEPIVEPVAESSTPNIPETPVSVQNSGSGRSSSRETNLATQTPVNEIKNPSETDSIVIKTDFDTTSFLEKYNVALKNQEIIAKAWEKYRSEKSGNIVSTKLLPGNQTASALASIKSNETWLGKKLDKFFGLFGFGK